MRRKSKRDREIDILSTTDDFMAAVPWGEHRKVLVFRRQHGGRTYVRLRTWNRHRDREFWYPTKRFFVIPVLSANDLADAIRAAAQDRQLHEKPEWYAAREAADAERYEELLDLDAPESVLKRAKDRIGRAR